MRPSLRRWTNGAVWIPRPRYRGLECEESVLIGESLPAEKLPEPFRLARRWPG